MSKSKKTTSTNKIPTWLEQGSQHAIDRSRQIADREYVPFTGQRVAWLDPQEQQAAAMATEGVGEYRGDLDRARDLTSRGSETFLDADIQGYMNPYIEGALNPALREVREQTARDINEVGSQAGKVGAFGGSRQAILESEARGKGLEAIGDTAARGYHSAFQSAADRWSADRDAAARGAEQFRALGAQGQQQLVQDINTLLTTGGLKRQLQQAGLDFDYNQFLEARDWDVSNLQPLITSLSAVPYSTTSTNKSKSSGLGNAIGVAATAAGAIMNPGGAMAGMMGGGGGDGGAPSAGGGGGGGKPQPSFGGDYVDPSMTTPTSYNPTFFGSAYQPVQVA